MTPKTIHQNENRNVAGMASKIESELGTDSIGRESKDIRRASTI